MAINASLLQTLKTWCKSVLPVVGVILLNLLSSALQPAWEDLVSMIMSYLPTSMAQKWSCYARA